MVAFNGGVVVPKMSGLFQPMEVYVDDEAKLTLHGLQQHYVKLKDAEKNRKLFELLDVLEFNQVDEFFWSVMEMLGFDYPPIELS